MKDRIRRQAIITLALIYTALGLAMYLGMVFFPRN